MRDMRKTIWNIPLRVLNFLPAVKVNMVWHTLQENTDEIKQIEEEWDKRHESWIKNYRDYYYGEKCPSCGATKEIEKRWRSDVIGNHCLFAGTIHTRHVTHWYCHSCKRVWNRDVYDDDSYGFRKKEYKEKGFVNVSKQIFETKMDRPKIQVDKSLAFIISVFVILYVHLFGVLFFYRFNPSQQEGNYYKCVEQTEQAAMAIKNNNFKFISTNNDSVVMQFDSGGSMVRYKFIASTREKLEDIYRSRHKECNFYYNDNVHPIGYVSHGNVYVKQGIIDWLNNI